MAGGPNIGDGKRGVATQTVGVLNLLTDLAYNLLIFFVVCASTEPEKGQTQVFPNASKEKATEQQTQNIKVELTRTTVKVDATEIPMPEFSAKMSELMAKKKTDAEKVVIFSSSKDTTFARWIAVKSEIERAGGIITLQVEDEREVRVR